MADATKRSAYGLDGLRFSIQPFIRSAYPLAGPYFAVVAVEYSPGTGMDECPPTPAHRPCGLGQGAAGIFIARRRLLGLAQIVLRHAVGLVLCRALRRLH